MSELDEESFGKAVLAYDLSPALHSREECNEVALRAAITAYLAKAGDGWLPIERAPRDGTRFCAPGDRQEDAWLIRFDDNDVGDKVFIGQDAEHEARAMWESMCGPNGTWNGYLFRLARPLPPPPKEPTNDR